MTQLTLGADWSPSPRLKMVVGLAFDLSRKMVVMVLKKTGPACVIGNWNGVGGKIEEGETAAHAMAREFEEETGVAIPEAEWSQFAHLEADNYDLFFFEAATPLAFNATTVEAEEIVVWKASDLLRQENVMPNIRWMVPFLQDSETVHDLGTLRCYR